MFSDDHQSICFGDGCKYYLKRALEHSVFDFPIKNCDLFKGKSMDDKDVTVTSLKIELRSLNNKCPISCDVIESGCDQSIEEIIDEFKKRAKFIIENVHHVNLVSYLNVECYISAEYLHVNLVQESVNGVRINKLFEQGVVPNLLSMAECVLKAISHLQSMDPKIKHGFIEPHQKHPTPSDDFNSLGLLMEYGNIKTQRLMKDFISKCYSEKRQSCWDLLTHEYLTNVHSNKFKPIYDGPFLKHFDIDMKLGSGSFGNVIKAKHADGQDSYALKLFEIPK